MSYQMSGDNKYESGDNRQVSGVKWSHTKWSHDKC